MVILRLKNGFTETQDERKAEFSQELKKLEGQHLRFRGISEPCSFHIGYLKGMEGQTITFTNGIADVMSHQEWTYPYWEVMIALEETK